MLLRSSGSKCHKHPIVDKDEIRGISETKQNKTIHLQDTMVVMKLANIIGKDGKGRARGRKNDVEIKTTFGVLTKDLRT
jgi:hypothetical protein